MMPTPADAGAAATAGVIADPTTPSFFFTNPSGEGLSYEQLKQRRAVAAALASRSRPYPTTIGQGLASAGESISNAMYEKQTEAFEAKQRALNRAALAPLPTAPPAVAPPTPHPAGASLTTDQPDQTAAADLTRDDLVAPAMVAGVGTTAPEQPASARADLVEPVMKTRMAA